MIEFVIGSALAASAGLNAWMPLFLLGLADRFLPAVELPPTWAWLSGDASLWISIGVGIVIALVVHAVKAIARPAANVATAGMAAPLHSTGEDVASFSLAAAAIVVPVLAALLLIALVVVIVLALRRRARTRRRRREDAAGPSTPRQDP